METILITGAGGFIGSHLVEMCVQYGYKVKAFIRYNSKNNWGWLEYSEFKNEIEIISGDVRDYDSVYKALAGCNTVFHLAALIGIPYSYISPLAYVKTNIEGTYNILEASKNRGIENILVTSTSETYGSAQYIPIDEIHPMIGQSPYSASKIAADQLALSYYRSFNLPVKIARPFNTYGPRQSARAVIPTIISQILIGSKTINLGNLTPTRDLTFVKDTCKGFIEIFKSETLFGEIINIGMNEEISIGSLVELIKEITGAEIAVNGEEQRFRPNNSEVVRLHCNNGKLIKNTNWKPEFDLRSGITATIEFINNFLNLYKPELYNV